MKNLKFSILAVATLFAGIASAQNLSTEVVVERSIKPNERTANRMNGLWPSVILPQSTPTILGTADYNHIADINRSYSVLNPVPGTALPVADDYRGYFAIGYFPTYNLGISAGYRAIDNKNTKLNLWTQFDGTNYYASEIKEIGKMKYNGAIVGADLQNLFSNGILFDASLNYQFANSGAYWRDSQSLNAGELEADICGNSGALSYNAGINIAIDAYGATADLLHKNPVEIESLTQTTYGFAGGVDYAFAENMSAGINVDADFVESFGIFMIKPRYTYTAPKFSATVGVNWGILTEGHSDMTLAPEINLNWSPLKNYALQLKVTGGAQHNSWRQIRAISPFVCANPAMEFDSSRIPLDAQLSMLFGPFEGFSAEVFGGFAAANDWLIMNAVSASKPFLQENIDGWHGGLKLNYQYRWAKVWASAELASSGLWEGYYKWRDRAKHVINVGAEVRPIEPLSIGIDYEFRDGRKGNTPYGETISAGCVSNLSLEASYQITPAIAVFATGENLLGRRYSILAGIEAQSTTGLIGASFKF